MLGINILNKNTNSDIITCLYRHHNKLYITAYHFVPNKLEHVYSRAYHTHRFPVIYTIKKNLNRE